MNTNTQAGDYAGIESTVKGVTVFFSGAEITHEAKAQLNKGANTLEISGLSSSVDINSIRIKTSNGVLVSAFEFVTKSADKENLLKKMQDTMDIYVAKSEKIRNDIRINSSFLDVMRNVLSSTAMEKENASDSFIRSMDYYGKKSGETENILFDLRIEEKQIQKSINELNNRMNRYRSKTGAHRGALKLSLSSPATPECIFNVMYYTALAGWIPYHDIRIAAIGKPVKITSKAKVAQNTGIEWKQVKLKLSTSMPSFGKTAPLFNAWILREIRPVITRSNDMMLQNSVSYKKSNEVMVLEEADSYADEVVAEPEFQNMNRYVALSDNTLNITYNTDLPYTVAGDGSEQNIELLTQETPAEYKHYCAPKLNPNTFMIAEIFSWEKLNLLSGKANITYDETFVGETYIDAMSTREALELTLGIDSRVVVRREKINEMSSRKIFGSDIKQEFSYRLTVRNNQSQPVKMVLKDQYPISTQKQIEVTLSKDTTPPSANKPELGVLTWEHEIANGTSQTYTFGYSVKYPKDLVLDL